MIDTSNIAPYLPGTDHLRRCKHYLHNSRPNNIILNNTAPYQHMLDTSDIASLICRRPIICVHVLPSFTITQAVRTYLCTTVKHHTPNQITQEDTRTKSYMTVRHKNTVKKNIIWQDCHLLRRSSCIIGLLIESAWLVFWLYFILLIVPDSTSIPS